MVSLNVFLKSSTILCHENNCNVADFEFGSIENLVLSFFRNIPFFHCGNRNSLVWKRVNIRKNFILKHTFYNPFTFVHALPLSPQVNETKKNAHLTFTRRFSNTIPRSWSTNYLGHYAIHISYSNVTNSSKLRPQVTLLNGMCKFSRVGETIKWRETNVHCTIERGEKNGQRTIVWHRS